jgi:type I restriction enzyme M protein
MDDTDATRLGSALWAALDRWTQQTRGTRRTDAYRDTVLACLLLRKLSDQYEEAAKDEIGADWPADASGDRRFSLSAWYKNNPDAIPSFERVMLRRMHYVVRPEHLWDSIAEKARANDAGLLRALKDSFAFIENHSFQGRVRGLFTEIVLDAAVPAPTEALRNAQMCSLVAQIDATLAAFPRAQDLLGDASDALLERFAATGSDLSQTVHLPRQVAHLLSRLAVLDAKHPETGQRDAVGSVLDFSCGDGALLLDVRRQMGQGNTGKLYGQEGNLSARRLARTNMLLHGLHESEFEILRGNVLAGENPFFRTDAAAKHITFDAVVARLPFSACWVPSQALAQDPRFKGYALPSSEVADFAYLLHGFHFLHQEGTMAVVMHQGALFRGKNEAAIRKKLSEDNHIDAVIELPANLFASTGAPTCALVLKKCKQVDDVLFINAAEDFKKGKWKNALLPEHVEKIVQTYRERREEPNYSRRVSLEEIRRNGFSWRTSVYVQPSAVAPNIEGASAQTKDFSHLSGANMALDLKDPVDVAYAKYLDDEEKAVARDDAIEKAAGELIDNPSEAVRLALRYLDKMPSVTKAVDALAALVAQREAVLADGTPDPDADVVGRTDELRDTPSLALQLAAERLDDKDIRQAFDAMAGAVAEALVDLGEDPPDDPDPDWLAPW